MRKKPEYTDLTDEAWKEFNEVAEEEGLGTHTDDWYPFYVFFERGYIAKMEDK